MRPPCLSLKITAVRRYFLLCLSVWLFTSSRKTRGQCGIQFSSSTILRLGVALLGARISAEQIKLLSPTLIAVIVGGVFATVLFSVIVNRFFFKWPKAEGALAGASVAICGASAAIALAATMNKKQLREQALLAIVVTVTILSTIAMVIYPMISDAMGFDQQAAGIFLGGTIHDVAQVVGAGAMIGPQALEISSMTKMLALPC